MRRVKLAIEFPNGIFGEIDDDLLIDTQIEKNFGELNFQNAVKLMEMSKIGIIVSGAGEEQFIPLKELL